MSQLTDPFVIRDRIARRHRAIVRLRKEIADLEALAAALPPRAPTRCTDIVREYLRDHRQATVATLADVSGFTPDAVRMALRKLRESGEVNNHRYGWWSATENLLRASTARGTVAA